MKSRFIALFNWGILVPFLFSACDSGTPQNKLGPAATAESIQKTQSQSLAKLNPLEVQGGQSVHIAETQEVITSDGPLHSLIKEWTIDVTQREDFKTHFELTTLKKVIEHNVEGKPISEFKSLFLISKNNLEPNQAHKTRTLARKLAQTNYKELQILAEDEGIEITDVSFHNLKTQSVILSPPPLIAESPDCRGFSPCKITADRITYDIVFHFSDDSTRSHQIEWQISSEVPFFAAILKQCATTLVPVEELRVLVKQCQEVVDFSF